MPAVPNWQSAITIVNSIEVGAMLRGVLERKDIQDRNDYMTTRNRLVQLKESPSELNLYSNLDIRENETELHSKEEECLLNEALKNTDVSVGAGFKIPGLIKADANWEHENSDARLIQKQKQTMFFSKIRFNSVAVACLDLSRRDLELSCEAINALERIDSVKKSYKNQIKGKQDKHDKGKQDKHHKRRHLYGLCTSFFKGFGSHINIGIFRLGGVLTWTSTFEGVSNQSLEIIKKGVNTALEGGVAVGYSGIEAKTSAKWLEKNHQLSENVNEDISSNIFVSKKQRGGDRPISSKFTQSEWEESLCEKSFGWSIIDRPNDYIGVWDMLPGHLEGLHKMLYDFFSTFLFRDRVDRLIDSGDCLDFILDALRHIRDNCNNCTPTDGVTKEWWHVLEDEKKVGDFLLKPRKYLYTLKTNDLEEIAIILDDLLSFVGNKSFPQKDMVVKMVSDIQRRKDER